MSGSTAPAAASAAACLPARAPLGLLRPPPCAAASMPLPLCPRQRPALPAPPAPARSTQVGRKATGAFAAQLDKDYHRMGLRK